MEMGTPYTAIHTHSRTQFLEMHSHKCNWMLMHCPRPIEWMSSPYRHRVCRLHSHFPNRKLRMTSRTFSQNNFQISLLEHGQREKRKWKHRSRSMLDIFQIHRNRTRTNVKEVGAFSWWRDEKWWGSMNALQLQMLPACSKCSKDLFHI